MQRGHELSQPSYFSTAMAIIRGQNRTLKEADSLNSLIIYNLFMFSKLFWKILIVFFSFGSGLFLPESIF